MSTPRRVLLWRHGRTEWNNAQRFQGHLDIPLDDVGRRQARRAAASIARPIDLIVSSDLSRAAETAQALAAVTGVDVVIDPGLREANAGAWQGKTHIEIQEEDPDLLGRWRSDVDIRPGGTGETRTEVGERVAAAVSRHTAALAPGGVAVFVTHGGAARAAVGHLLGIPAVHWHHLAVMGNCSWTELDATEIDASEGGSALTWRLLTYNRAAISRADEPAASVRDAIV